MWAKRIVTENIAKATFRSQRLKLGNDLKAL